ncbi:MAG: FAD-dependent oxidoreductase [Aquisalimonadaceae bacterium]
MKTVNEPARGTEVQAEVDVLVVGGGSAGLASAIAAARQGANVMLVERYGFLGGTLTAVTLGSICGFFTVTEDEINPVVKGLAWEMVERLRARGGALPPRRWLQTASVPYDPMTLKLVADDMAEEAGVQLVYHSLAVQVVRDGNQIGGVIFESKSGRWACLAPVVIDATGDGDIATLAGAGMELTLEQLQFPTTMFRFGGVDTRVAQQLDRNELHSCLNKAVDAGFTLPRTAGGMFSMQPGTMHLNITRVAENDRSPNPVDTHELTRAEINGRRQLGLYAEAFRRFVPGFEDCYVLDAGAQIGVRESRRIKGDYWLTLDDVMNEGRFYDAIACSAWPLEEHTADKGTRWVWLEPGTYYQIPYRCLLPEGLDGLLVVGRCSSASHDAHASMRVAAVCMALGEAAGVAAVMAGASGDVRGIDTTALRRRLTDQGAWLGEDVRTRGQEA